MFLHNVWVLMGMLSSGFINLSFRKSATAVAAHNDNDHLRMVFTAQEIQDLHGLSKLYVRQGALIEPIFKKGDGISCVIFDRHRGPKATVMAIVKNVPEKDFPNYMVNFGIGFQPTATINFADVLRLGRQHLGRVLSTPDRAFDLI